MGKKLTLIFCLGPTGVGKSTLVEYAATQTNCGCIQVGKLLRAKYPPEHFQVGDRREHGNPRNTKEEAWQLLLDGTQELSLDRKWFAWIDGQPRDVEQVERVHAELGDYNKVFLNLHAPREVRWDRLKDTHGDDRGSLALAEGRLDGDVIALYDVISKLLELEYPVITLNTADEERTPFWLFQDVMGRAIV